MAAMSVCFPFIQTLSKKEDVWYTPPPTIPQVWQLRHLELSARHTGLVARCFQTFEAAFQLILSA